MMKHDEQYRVYCLSKALTPITHMSGSSGNESMLQREKVFNASGEHWVPFISGNAIRHCILRSTIMHRLVMKLGLKGKLSIEQANFLFHGGALHESAGTEDLGMMRSIQEIIPAIRLLGGSLTNRIIDGQIRVSRGVLVCAENAARLNKSVPESYVYPDNLLGSKAFEGEYQYTRTDIRRLKSLEAISEDALKTEHQSNLMIFAGQTIVPGSIFVHDFQFQGTEIELGCVLQGILDWQAAGGVIGGQAARGHGRLSLEWTIIGYNGSELEAIQAYDNHVVATTNQAIAWLNDVFKPKEKKKEKKSA